VFYVQRDNESALIPCGDKLRDMVSELNPGEHVTEFVSAGAKNYAYKIANSATVETKTVKYEILLLITAPATSSISA
jgi:hypothetical protein